MKGNEIMMKKNKIITITALILIITVLIAPAASAARLADPLFESVTTNLLSAKVASFSAMTNEVQNRIAVTRCMLYKKNGAAWIYVRDLPTPSEVGMNTLLYGSAMDYSGYIGSGTYRLYVTYCADEHSISRYSNTRTY